jgi:hypothetical protein
LAAVEKEKGIRRERVRNDFTFLVFGQGGGLLDIELR